MKEQTDPEAKLRCTILTLLSNDVQKQSPNTELSSNAHMQAYKDHTVPVSKELIDRSQKHFQ